MDIAKYIGQFLLKNNYCYIHGLGNLELIKKPAANDGKTLLPASYEVVLTAGGSIDDSFANFIATNEQISISKAANSLRDFSMQSRADLQAGKEVPIAGIGKFVEDNGRIRFITDALFRHTPAGIPVLKNSKQLEEQKAAPVKPATALPKSVTPKTGRVNWTNIIIIVILVILLAGGGFGYYYYTTMQHQSRPAPMITPDTLIELPPPAVPDSAMAPIDSSAATSTTVAPDSTTIGDYRFVIGFYASKAPADRRYRQLKIGGNPGIEEITRDSLTYRILLPMRCRVVDTSHVIDSLKVFYGFKDVVIYHE